MENNTINFIIGGKLGDFIHALFAVKHICKYKNTKANVYICDIGWEFGIRNTYTELHPILMQQEYISSFNILENYTLDSIQTPQQNSPIIIRDKKLISEGYICLIDYISSPLLYQTCWSDIYSKTFNFPIDADYKWITYNNINSDLYNKILIQRKANVMRNSNFPYKEIIDHYGKENILFISSTEEDYNSFPYKNEIEFYKVSTLDEWFTSINSSSLIIANLSAPAAMTQAMDKPRIIELPLTSDYIHYLGEEKYSNNMHWFLSSQIHNL